MATSATESSSLSLSSSREHPRIQRTVTFGPDVTISPPRTATAETSPLRSAPLPYQNLPSSHYAIPGQPMLSALNNKFRRRNSHGAPLAGSPLIPSTASKIGPQRTTKNTQKLKLLPNPDPGEDGPDEESGRDVYSQFTRIKDPNARRDAARLGKADRDRLPRVTAYCTANSYRLDALMRFLKGRGRTRGANPKQFDECVYTPYNYGRGRTDKSTRSTETDGILNGSGVTQPPPMRERRYSDSALEIDGQPQHQSEDLIDLTTEAGDTTLDNGENTIPNHTPSEMEQPEPPRLDTLDFDTQVHTPEVFLFEYGTVVIWGMTLAHEQRFLKEIAKFETEKLGDDDVQTENFNFYYTREYQARIYNDFISLREKKNYMTKLAISHALAQSVKVRILQSPSHMINRILILCGEIDIPLRGPPLNHHNRHHTPSRSPRRHRLHLPLPSRHQQKNRRTLHPPHKPPSPRLCPRFPRTHVGGTAVRACLWGGKKLFGDGSESAFADGEIGCAGGFVGGAEGSG
jgi:uncharacterized Rmd1/YagE family protein